MPDWRKRSATRCWSLLARVGACGRRRRGVEVDPHTHRLDAAHALLRTPGLERVRRFAQGPVDGASSLSAAAIKST